jgi:asparagine synthase (glutamine-hydrolysing)
VQSERIPRLAAAAGRALFAALPAPAHERSRMAEAKRFFAALTLPFDERVTMWNSLFFDDLTALLRPDFVRSLSRIDRLHYLEPEREHLEGRSTLSRLLHVNFTSYLADDLLVKTDRCTMANSLEARSPFLDRELIEYAAVLPDRFKLDGHRSKAILKDAFADLVPPEIERRGKMGFGVPLGAWFRGELREYMRDLLLPSDARYRDMLSGPFVEGVVTRHLSGDANLGQQLWSLICFERWLQMLPDWRRGARPPSAPPSAASVMAASTP